MHAICLLCFVVFLLCFCFLCVGRLFVCLLACLCVCVCVFVVFVEEMELFCVSPAKDGIRKEHSMRSCNNGFLVFLLFCFFIVCFFDFDVFVCFVCLFDFLFVG